MKNQKNHENYLCLEPWQEVIGIFIELRENKTEAEVLLNIENERVILYVAKTQSELESLRFWKGEKISILRTKKDFLVKVVK